ncbi:Esterase inpF [Hyphodiscus hymeniophilus]|uniref:Esterase inpF n=1 Tax=Hyphodiscus hymeniophilus TaxID=353542 RepID=A0A9P7AYR4_9HELO|nr:Esterase inpF [Hyphodiscus hymeniophilus]
MTAQNNGTNGVPVDASFEVTPRKLKILMLHGYTQNGRLFHAKTRGLEKLLLKAFPAASPKNPSTPLTAQYPGGVQLLYPTGPIQLVPADIPGFDINAAQGDTESDSWGWWKRETGGAKYVGIEEGLDSIAKAIEEAGGVDGVIGFSQGAAGAGMVASLLEPGREAAFEAAKKENAEALGYPSSWAAMMRETGQRQLSFAGFYEPKISTPMCHYIGSLDSVVEESRSLAFVDACKDARKVYHPGGHFVPAGKEMASVLVGFIKESCMEKEADESVEDMDVPF